MLTVNFLAGPGVLILTGDTDFPGEDDTFKLVRDDNNTSQLDVFENGSFAGQFTMANVQQINVNTLGGNDTLIVDSANGLINSIRGIRYDGGAGFDQLILLQEGGTGSGSGSDLVEPQQVGPAQFVGDTQTSDVYFAGPLAGSGTSTITGPSGTQVVQFQNLEPVLDLVPAASLAVNGTNANNAINYTQGSVVANGLVSVDEQEPIEFSNKDGLIINALPGSDTVNLNNPTVPIGATPGGLKAITIDGADPTGSDTLVDTAEGLTAQLIVLPSGQGAGVIIHNNVPQPQVVFSGIEHLNLVGQQGAKLLRRRRHARERLVHVQRRRLARRRHGYRPDAAKHQHLPVGADCFQRHGSADLSRL